MANKEHLEILKQGVKVWNQWRKDNPDIMPNLIGANLSGYDLSRYDLSRADLYYAILRDANLSSVDLSYADLTSADLRDANLIGTYLRRADLSYADLWGCIGKNKEGVTFFTEFYTVNFTKDFLNIGCKTYSYEKWFGFTDDEIAEMAIDALEFWNKYKENIKELKVKYGF
jgi:hypothetical protein